MTTPRRRLLILLLATLVIVPVAGWVVWRAATKPEAVKAYERLRLGMTKGEVEKAIGMPPGYYRSYPRVGIQDGNYVRQIGPMPDAAGRPISSLPYYEGTVERWTWDDFWIWVAFGEDGKAVGFYLLEPHQPPTLLERVRKWLGL
jgi:hypothetical protein